MVYINQGLSKKPYVTSKVNPAPVKNIFSWRQVLNMSCENEDFDKFSKENCVKSNAKGVLLNSGSLSVFPVEVSKFHLLLWFVFMHTSYKY